MLPYFEVCRREQEARKIREELRQLEISYLVDGWLTAPEIAWKKKLEQELEDCITI